MRSSTSFLSHSLILFSIASPYAFAQSREEKVRNDQLRVSKSGLWHYNDLDTGFAEATRSRKPLMVVFRCIPCTECVKLDDDVMEENSTVLNAMKRFVRVRQVSTNGIDLARYQFDFDQSFAVLFFHPDGTLIGRYGTRSHHSEWKDDVSVAGLGAAMEKALEWFAKMESDPSIRDLLSAKQSSRKDQQSATMKLIAEKAMTQEILQPEDYPTLKKYPTKLDFSGPVVKNCIHCHQVGDAIKEFALQNSPEKRLPTTLLFPYPHPKILGILFDVESCTTVNSVLPNSVASAAGLVAGDTIAKANGQLLLSMADLQWVLHNLSEEARSLEIEVDRAGRSEALTLNLPKDWRTKDDISWRVSSWELRRIALGGLLLKELSSNERQKMGLPEQGMALRVQHVGEYPPHNRALIAGVRKNDLLLGVDGKTDLVRETDILRYLLENLHDERKSVQLRLKRGDSEVIIDVPKR